jgi:hypothetical protein
MILLLANQKEENHRTSLEGEGCELGWETGHITHMTTEGNGK